MTARAAALDDRLPRRAERRHGERLRLARQDRPPLPAQRSQRQARHRPARRLLAARRQRQADARSSQHICWDGCMFPNAVMMQPADLERRPGDDDRGPRRARLGLKRHDEQRRTLNIGLVGYGFMGRTHSNAFLQAPRFFDLPYRPVLKAVAARNADRVKAFADNWGYESVETDWRELVERKDIDVIDIASPNDTHARDRHRRGQGRQDGDVREAARPNRRRSARRWSTAVEAAGVPNMVWYNYRRVPAVTLVKQLHRRGQARAHLPLPRASSCRTGRSRPTCRRAAKGSWRLDVARRRQRRHRRPARALHRHRALAERPDRRSHGDDRDVRQGAQAQPDRQGRAGRHRRRQRVPVPLRERLARPRSKRPATPAGTRRSTRSRSTASTPRLAGTCTTCTACSTSITATKGASAAGAASTSPTATIPT